MGSIGKASTFCQVPNFLFVKHDHVFSSYRVSVSSTSVGKIDF